MPLGVGDGSADVPVVSGGPESLLAVLEQGLIDGRQPAVLAGDAACRFGSGGRDADRHRRAAPARAQHRPDARQRQPDADRRRGDPAGPGAQRPAAVPRRRAPDGRRAIRASGRSTASSGASFADTVGAHRAVRTCRSRRSTATRRPPGAPTRTSTAPGQWLEVVLDTPRRVDRGDRRLRRRPAGGGAGRGSCGSPPTRARSTGQLPDTPGPHRLSTLPGLTTTVRVTVLALRHGLRGRRGGPARARHPRADRAARVCGRRPTSPAVARRRSTRSTAGRASAARASRPGGIRCDQFLARAGEEPLGHRPVLQRRRWTRRTTCG